MTPVETISFAIYIIILSENYKSEVSKGDQRCAIKLNSDCQPQHHVLRKSSAIAGKTLLLGSKFVNITIS